MDPSFKQRFFFQRLNEQHLAHQLEDLSISGHQGTSEGASGHRLFDPKIRLRPTRRISPVASSDSGAGVDSDGALPLDRSRGAEFGRSQHRKPWLQYESLRGETYPGSRVGAASSSKGPRWQDLTHSEAQRLQEMYMRKRMLDRKVLWMKMQGLPNPEREAKMTLRRQKQEEEQQKEAAAAEASGAMITPMYPPPFLDAHPASRKMQNLEERARLEELESRFRSRIRQQKLENARTQKRPAPKVGDFVTDPIQRHVQRRLVRQRVKIHAGMETFLTRNTAQILYEHLGGAQVSIVKVRAKRPRATQQLHYSLTSDHDPEWVQRQLDTLTPKLRSQFAVRMNPGQTPDMRFVPVVRAQDIRRKGLWRSARKVLRAIPPGGVNPSAATAREAAARSGTLNFGGS